jgi:hypothetical protein
MVLSNSERQALWRARRAAEIRRLRKVAKDAPEDEPDEQERPRPKRRRGGPFTNAERQAQWRANRAAEIERLRKGAAKTRPAAEVAPEPEEDDPEDRSARLAVRRRQKRGRYVTPPPKPAAPARPSGKSRSVTRLHNTTPMKSLTREEVDPEFKGTAMEWVIKYGHVQTHTAEQYATMRFEDWVGFARDLAKRGRAHPALKDVDHNWLRSPTPYGIKSLTESLEFLRPKIAELEALLTRATAALAKKKT